MVDVLIQTQNEELNLPVTLASVQGWAHRVFVVDSGSTDATVRIATEAGATVVHHAWEGYARQKNWALDNLPWESDWILIVDADEIITPELRDEIIRVSSEPAASSGYSGYYINRMLVFMGRKIRHCGYYPSWNLRLFKRGKARYEDRRVHEHMIVDGPTKHLKEIMLHEDRRGLEHFIAKHNRYSTLEAQEVYEAPAAWPGRAFFTDSKARRRFLKTRVLPQLPVPWLWKFLYMYIYLEGFADRMAGWNLCMFVATYEFFIHLKVKELRRLKGRMPVVREGLSVPEGGLVESKPSPKPASSPQAFSSSSASVFNALPKYAMSAPISAGAKAPVSVIVPTLNEAGNIAACLDHLQWADEVFVVDSGSRDRTCEIAAERGATVINFKWNGQWPKKKNWALRNLEFKHDWVLIVDADEWITRELADEIAQAIKNPAAVGYYLNRRFMFMNAWIKHCGYYPSWNLRLLKRGCGEYEKLTDMGDTGSGDNEVHEHVVLQGPSDYLKHDMLHFAFPSINVFMEKHNRYSNWEAAFDVNRAQGEQSAVKGSRLSWRRRLKEFSRHLPFRPTLRFIYSYILRFGFMDGYPGLVFCRLLAIYEYLSVSKAYELKRMKSDAEQVR